MPPPKIMMFSVMTRNATSRQRLQCRRARNADPISRLSMEIVVSTCQRWP